MSYRVLGDQCDKKHFCHRLQGTIDFGLFRVIKDEIGAEFWGIKNTSYVQTGVKELGKDVKYSSPPFFYCPYCGNQIVEFIEIEKMDLSHGIDPYIPHPEGCQCPAHEDHSWIK